MNKKGFTIVELLAVLIVLALILLIAIPKVLNIIETSKMKSFEINANKLVHEALKEYAKDSLEKKYIIENGEFTLNNLKVNGELPLNATIMVSSDGEVAIAAYNDKWCAIKNVNEDRVTVDTDIEDCKIVEPTPLSCFTYTKTDTEVTITDYSNDVGCLCIRKTR